MKRREILKYSCIATGAVVSAPLMSSLLSGCNPEIAANTDGYILQFFDNQEFAFVKDFIDTILPKTDSPSATDVGVHKMLDHMVGDVHNSEYKENFRKSLKMLSSYLNDGGSFIKLNAEQKLSSLQQLDNSQDESLGETKRSYLALKRQAVSYYLNTEEIGTKFLSYLPVPGKYESCISVEEAGGKLWAL